MMYMLNGTRTYLRIIVAIYFNAPMRSIISDGIGYFVLLRVGFLMALVGTFLVKAETKWLGTRKTSEWFPTGIMVTITGSLIRPEKFNFAITRQKIHVVDEKIRSMMSYRIHFVITIS
jgi:hypothetical protein